MSDKPLVAITMGDAAGIGAGLMRENGTYYLLLPRKVSP